MSDTNNDNNTASQSADATQTTTHTEVVIDQTTTIKDSTIDTLEEATDAAEHAISNIAVNAVRYWYLLVGAWLVVILLFLVDPDVGVIQSLSWGGSTFAWLIQVLRGMFSVTVAYFTFGAILNFDPKADFNTLIEKAKESSQGAGLVVIAYAIMLASILYTFTIK